MGTPHAPAWEVRPTVQEWPLQNSYQPFTSSRCAARRRMLEDLTHLASKLFGRPVQRTRSVQNGGECSLFLKSHLASQTVPQMCTKRFQFLAAELVVEIAQEVDTVIAGVHLVAFGVPIVGPTVRNTQARKIFPGTQQFSPCSRTSSSRRSVERDFLE